MAITIKYKHGLYLCRVRGLKDLDYIILKFDKDGWWQYWRDNQREEWIGNYYEVLEVMQLIEEIE